MRIAIIYDCLYPHTVGGAERWYRVLAEHLAQHHEVTYLTRKQWQIGERLPRGVSVEAVSPGGPLYKESGERRALPAVLFGLGTFWYMLKHGKKFAVVDCGSFPFTSLLAARAALSIRHSQAVLVGDWYECWTRNYWISYLGAIGGRIGYAVQKLCLRSSSTAITFSQFVTDRLQSEGFRGEIVRLPGLYHGQGEPVGGSTTGGPPEVVYAGRHIPEKRVTSIPAAIAQAREQIPDLVCTVFGDGTERPALLATIQQLGLQNTVRCPGFVERSVIDDHMSRALCLLLPSRREGYGIVVVESAALGTPSVVTASPDSAATELIRNGENGYVARSAEPADVAAAIVRVYREGAALRRKTAEWFRQNADWLSAERSAELAEELFARAARNG